MISERVVEAIVYLHNEIIKKCVLFVVFAHLLPPKGGIGLFLWKRKDCLSYFAVKVEGIGSWKEYDN